MGFRRTYLESVKGNIPLRIFLTAGCYLLIVEKNGEANGKHA